MTLRDLLRSLLPGPSRRPALPRSGGGTAWRPRMTRRFHELTEDRRPAFRERGFTKKRPFFPHTLHYLPKAAPDALRLAEWMCGSAGAGDLWEVILTAGPSARRDLPPELFSDDDLLWHGQAMGLTGHVAYAALVADGATLYGLSYVSDLVQRAHLFPEHETRIHGRFRRWYYLLLNGILAFARRRGFRRFCSPTADHVLAHTDPERDVSRELFDRVYDHSVRAMLEPAGGDGWWVVDLDRTGPWPVAPEPRSRELRSGTTVCLLHDIEGGAGHRDADPELARAADAALPDRLREMLRLEREAGVAATYSVVGRLMDRLRPELESEGHALAFHSYDHRLDRRQLERCREVDYRIPGYRPPRSVITDELLDGGLVRHNFEWIASSGPSLGCERPVLEDSLVRIPVALDDHPLHAHGVAYGEWEERVLETVRRRDFVALGLHDCYADHWLPRYARLLEELKGRAELRTMDQVAARTALGSAV